MTTASKAFHPVSATTGGIVNPFAGVLGFLERLVAARRCAAALEMRRQPAKRDLKTLGLEMFDFTTLPH